jgi:hypothetical protein
MMTVARFAFAVLTIGALMGPLPAHGQLVAGVFGARARDSFGGTNGIGAEVGVSLPVIPLEVFGAGTLFYPACSGCDLNGWSLGVNLTVLPIGVLKPYLSFGRTWRDLEDPSVGLITDDDGLFAGVGLEIGLRRAGIFAEGRYEFLTETVGSSPDLRQWVFRAGLMMRWGGLSP